MADIMDSLKRRKLKVLHVLSSADIAGGERYVMDLIRSADASFAHLVVLPYPGPFRHILSDINCSYCVVHMTRKFSARSVLSLVRCIKTNSIDIVHTHGYRANFYGRIACTLAGTKCVSTVHVSLYDYTGTSFFARHIYMVVERLLSNRTDVFMCISNAMKEDMLRLGIDPQKIVVIQNGVDLQRFYPRAGQEHLRQELGLTTKGPVVGTVGRMVTEKGQVHLVEALRHLKNEWKELKCLLVGEGPLLPQLKKMALDAGVANMCIFPGIRKDIEFIYPLLDIFVLPSLREPFGLALLEAMACGVPVIATASGGPLGFVNPDVNGALVPPANPELLASKISYLLSHRDKAQAIAAEGRKTVEREFSIKETVRRVEEVYRSRH